MLGRQFFSCLSKILVLSWVTSPNLSYCSDFPDSCEGLHKLPCGWDQPDQMCTWKALSFNTVDQLTASVPVGCLEDGFLVSTVTLVTYSLCSVAIAYFIFVHGKKQRSD